MALNRVTLQGRLVADPEMRTVGEDTNVTTIRIAVDRNRVNKETGDREADFIDVVAWRNAASFVCKYFAKGDAIIVDGRLQSRNWTDKDGNKRTAIEVVAENLYFSGGKRESAQVQNQQSVPVDNDDGDLPF